MKELTSSYQEKKGFWRKARRATAIAGAMVALTACEQQSKITEGTVYKKQYTEESIILTPQIIGFSQVLRPSKVPEEWKIYIAQCPKGELPPQDKIKKECKTNSFAMPQEVYNSLQMGQHADFKQAK